MLTSKTQKILLFCLFIFYTNMKAAAEDKHLLLQEKHIPTLYNLALEVSDIIDSRSTGKKQVLIGFGQSPAYLLEMIKFIDDKKDKTNREYLHVASSRFRFGLHDFYKEQFKQYYASLNLSKDNFDQEDTTYIAMDYCFSGASLMLFHEWLGKPKNMLLLGLVTHGLAKEKKESIVQIKLRDKAKELIQILANDATAQDRLVPFFSYREIGKLDPSAFKPHNNALKLLSLLKKFVKKQTP